MAESTLVEPGILSRFATCCQQDPDRSAVVGGSDPLTYSRLARRAAAGAALLRGHGVGREDLVGIVAERSPEFVAMVLAVFQAGAGYVPIEPTVRVDRARAMCDTGRVRTLFAQPKHREFADRVAAQTLVAPQVIVGTDAESPEAADPTERDPDGLAYVIFTSGSTGAPKGAMVVDRGMDNHLVAKVVDLGLRPDDVVGLTAPLSFDISVWQALAPLAAGACVAVASALDISEPAALGAWTARHRVSVLEIVPSFLAVVLDEMEQDSRLVDRFASLRTLIATGEALPGPLAERWLRMFPHTALLNAYGPTECSDDVTHHVVTLDDCAEGRWPPIGKEVRNTTIHVIDAHGRECPTGVEGELYVGGEGVGRGYLNDPARTAAVFVPDYLSGKPGRRLYRTGDRASRAADGTIRFSGRQDRQVKVRGQRVELGDVEAQLLKVPGVNAAACVVDDGVLRAFVTLLRTEPVEGAQTRILNQVRASAPHYLVPHEVRVLDAMPTGATGKVDLKALAALRPATRRTPDDPRDGADELDAVCDLMAEFLGVAQLGPDADFFATGGDSLKAMRLIALARDRFDAEGASLGDFLAEPTPRGLLAALRSAPQPQPVADHVTQGPLSAAQERLWFIEQLSRGRGPQLVRLAVSLRGPVDEPALRHALNAVIARHEPLRSVVVSENGKPFSKVSPQAEIALETGTGDADGDPTEFLPRAELSVGTPQPPLMAARLTRIAPDHHVLGLVLHHLVCDGVSLGVLGDEIRTYYERHRAGITSFQQPQWTWSGYVAAERSWLDGPEGTACEQFWATRLDGAPTLIELPLDRPRPARPEYATANVVRLLTPVETARVGNFSRRCQGTAIMAVTAAFFATLSRITGSPDLVFGMDSANRSWPGSDTLIGTFVNQLPLRLTLPEQDHTFQGLFAMVRDRSFEAYRQERLPYHRIVAVTGPQRAPGRPPLFQVKITQQGAWQAGISLPGCEATPLEIAEPAMDLDLMLDVSQPADRLRLELLYRPELMDRSTVAGWLDSTIAGLLIGVQAPESELRRPGSAPADPSTAIEKRM